MSEAATGDVGGLQASSAALTGKPAYDRADFLGSYYVFCQATERIYQEVLMIRKLPVDTYQLWAAVRDQGGHQQVHQRKLWAATARLFNHPRSWTNASHYFRTTYESAGLAELEDLVDSGRFNISQHNTEQQQQQQQQQHMLNSDPIMDGGSNATAAGQPLTGPAMPLSLQQQQLQPQAGTMSLTTTSQDDTQQQSSSLVSCGSGFGTSVVQQQQQQQQSNPYAALRLAVRCGAARGVFDIPRQRATCYCAACVTAAGPGGIDMMPTEFERHGGCGSFKKWKKSIIVEETGRNLGAWLTQHGVVILSPSALTKKVKKRQLEETLEANRASGNYAGAAQAAAGTAAASPAVRTGSNSRGLRFLHAPVVAAQSLQQQQQQHTRLDPPAFAAASVYQREHGDVSRYGSQRAARASSSASRQVHHQATASQAEHHQQCRSPHQQYSMTQHDVMRHSLDGSWDSHQILDPSAERSGSGFSLHRPPLPGLSMGQIVGPTYAGQHSVGFRPQQGPEGSALVGSRIRVWWPLDRAWYCALVQAYHPTLQQHMLFYDDGDWEQVDLAEQQWEVVAAAPAAAGIKGPMLQLQTSGSPQSTGTQQMPRHDSASLLGATAAAAAVAGFQTAVPMDADASNPEQLQQQKQNLICTARRQYSPAAGSTPADDNCLQAEQQQEQYSCTAHRQYNSNSGSTPEDDFDDNSDAEWLAAAEAAAVGRPLRVMWDSHAGVMRVIAAADLLLAEQEMRRQHRHMKQQQQQRQISREPKQQRPSQQQQQDWHADPLPAQSHAAAAAVDRPSVTAATAAAAVTGSRHSTSTCEVAGSAWGDQPPPWPSHAQQQQQQQRRHEPAAWQQQASGFANMKALPSAGMRVTLTQPADLQQQQQQQQQQREPPAGQRQACNSAHWEAASCCVGSMPGAYHLRPAGAWQQQQQQQHEVSRWQDQPGVEFAIAGGGQSATAQQQQQGLGCRSLEAGHRGAAADGTCLQQQQQQRQWQPHQGLDTAITSADTARNRQSPATCQVQVQACQDSPGYEVLAMLPGYSIQDVRIKAWDDGRLLIKAAKQYSSTIAQACTAQAGSIQASNGNRSGTAAAAAVAAASTASNIPGGSESLGNAGSGISAAAGIEPADSSMRGGGASYGVHAPAPLETLVQLPGRVDSRSASALMTQDGELYVRIRGAAVV